MKEHELKDYTVNYAEVVKTGSLSSVTRLLAAQRMADPYGPVGEWISNLSNSDIKALLDEKVIDDHSDHILIAEMLATGEGLPNSDSFDTFTFRAKSLISFLLVESLARQGLCKVFPENMSFDEDMADRPICERIEGFDYGSFSGDNK